MLSWVLHCWPSAICDRTAQSITVSMIFLNSVLVIIAYTDQIPSTTHVQAKCALNTKHISVILCSFCLCFQLYVNVVCMSSCWCVTYIVCTMWLWCDLPNYFLLSLYFYQPGHCVCNIHGDHCLQSSILIFTSYSTPAVAASLNYLILVPHSNNSTNSKIYAALSESETDVVALDCLLC